MYNPFDPYNTKLSYIEKKNEILYSGKAKTLFKTNDPYVLIQHFNDDATAFNGKKKDVISNKGIYNNISSIIFSHLHFKNINTHFLGRLNDREMLVSRVDIYPIEVVVRNIVAGSLSKRLGIEEGKIVNFPIIEYYYKNDELDDPMVISDHIFGLGLIKDFDKSTLELITNLAYHVNYILKEFFEKRNILLVDMKLEFGFEHNRKFTVLADEISPDTCRLWDMTTNEKLDKDRFRRDLGGVEESYKEILNRLL
jgi:phosphoribosylaminoimidazole-succinocarboxamide synthase